MPDTKKKKSFLKRLLGDKPLTTADVKTKTMAEVGSAVTKVDRQGNIIRQRVKKPKKK